VNRKKSIEVHEELKSLNCSFYKEWKKNPTKGNNHQQSWNAFKGKNFEKFGKVD